MKKQTNLTTKGHLIRGAFYLLRLIAACAIPFALAQRNVFPQVVLYDQYDNDLNDSVTSAFSPDDCVSAEAADNFVVPATETWQITEVDVRGSIWGGPFDVHFYTDAEGLPGTEVYVATGLVGSSNFGDCCFSDYIIRLTTPATLSEGTYWVSVVGTGFWIWSWEGRSITNNGFATAWRKPWGSICPAPENREDGSGTDCTDWTRLQDCLGIPWPDQMFRLVSGPTPTPTPPTPTPSARPTPTPRTRPTPLPRP